MFRFERAALREIREQRNTSGRKAKHKITLNLTKFHSKTALLWRFKIAGKNNKTYTGLRVKFPIFLPDFNINEGFSTDFYKRTPPPIPNFTQIRPLEVALIRPNTWTERGTNMTKFTGNYHGYANTRKIGLILLG